MNENDYSTVRENTKISGGGKGRRWKTFHHNGVYFTQPFESLPNDAKVRIRGKIVNISPQHEEYLVKFVQFLSGEQGGNKTAHRNFINDFNKITKLGVKHLDDFDFSGLSNYLANEQEKRKMKSPDEKLRDKQAIEKVTGKYKIVNIDGISEPVGNFQIEAAGVFHGRGSHPLVGRIKIRIKPEDVTLNLSKDAKVPIPNISGDWGNIIHDPDIMWLASWKDPLTMLTKYVYPSVNSSQRGDIDKTKYDNARLIGKYLPQIRKRYFRDMDDRDPVIQQLAIAIYFIDSFALRVGNEKGDNTADTVGVTLLRWEHVTFKQRNMIHLDFLGKDSVPYKKTLVIDKKVYSFLETEYRKYSEIYNQNTTTDSTTTDYEQLFFLIDSKNLNDYLDDMGKGVKTKRESFKLTAKVFRTFHASTLLQNGLKMALNRDGSAIPMDEKRLREIYDSSIHEVAILCNHQKQVSKNHKESLKKIRDKLAELINEYTSPKKDLTEKQIMRLKEQIANYKEKIQLKNKVKNLNLGTSKMNYLDPRITIAFAKKHKIPIEKFFNKSLIERFSWAMDVSADYEF